jgi:pyridoxine 5-phosphate synthase
MDHVRLHVNVDHVATLRQARGEKYPDPVWAASLCEMAGADGITIHLREDRRHIVDRDVRMLRETVRSVVNLEMAATEEMVRIAKEIKPDMCTLVPEKREERTTEGGLDVASENVAAAVRELGDENIEVSLFINPDRKDVQGAGELGADLVELHTGYYCHAEGIEQTALQINRLAAAAEQAMDAGMRVAAGHGLDYTNVRPVAAVPGVEELNIGHSIVSRAVFVGMDRAVRDMIALIREGAY